MVEKILGFRSVMFQVVARYPGVDFSEAFGIMEVRGKVKAEYMALYFIGVEVIIETLLWMK